MDATILAVGNSEKGDDGIGLYAGKLLEEKGFSVIFCGTMPENFLGRVKTKVAIVVDAAAIEKDFLITEDIDELPSYSTHGMSLSLMRTYLKNNGIRLVVAGIMPESNEAGAQLSEKAKERAERLVEALESILCGDESPLRGNSSARS